MAPFYALQILTQWWGSSQQLVSLAELELSQLAQDKTQLGQFVGLYQMLPMFLKPLQASTLMMRRRLKHQNMSPKVVMLNF
ncbi:hypothetical protein PIB30_115231 [Stylosanthes scabra]|uniref:Uncharacterized protein n=1 Tax=Stylosanthes scabra TaxID=79078 RepID=A0ABU6W005_9FABA|nr:hypothetical protein [Stylosanthes scabra]